jgi:peroxiredoxin
MQREGIERMVEKEGNDRTIIKIIPDFNLVASDGKRYNPGLYRHKKNLVLVFVQVVQCASCYMLLSVVKRDYQEIRALNSEVLFIISGNHQTVKDLQHQWMVPFPLLADPDDHVASKYLETNLQHRPVILIVDRFGVVWKYYISGITKEEIMIKNVLEWLNYIEIQCPECDVLDQPPVVDIERQLPNKKIR